MNETVIFSPVSIFNVLTLLTLAAHGITYEQLRQSLHLNANKSLVAIQFHEYNRLLQNSSGSATLSIANQIYVNDDYTLNKTFREMAANKFSCGIEALNFSDSIQAAQTINKFCAEKTGNKITNCMQSGSIQKDIAALLMNAIYFKGSWKYKFDQSLTAAGDFYVNENEVVRVDFMKIQSNFFHKSISELEASALEMKYADSNYSFVILLPWNRTGLSALELKLKSFDMKELMRYSKHKFAQRGVDVKIPKFKVEQRIALSGVLKNVCTKSRWS